MNRTVILKIALLYSKIGLLFSVSTERPKILMGTRGQSVTGQKL